MFSSLEVFKRVLIFFLTMDIPHCTFCREDLYTGSDYLRSSSGFVTLLNRDQPTLGSGLLVFNGHHERLSALDPGEMLGYMMALKELELALLRSFQPDRVDVLISMNLIPHFHAHVIPRYATAREFAGRTWVDHRYTVPGSFPIAGAPQEDALLIEVSEHLFPPPS